MVLNKASVTQARHGDAAVWPGRLGGAPRLVPPAGVKGVPAASPRGWMRRPTRPTLRGHPSTTSVSHTSAPLREQRHVGMFVLGYPLATAARVPGAADQCPVSGLVVASVDGLDGWERPRVVEDLGARPVEPHGVVPAVHQAEAVGAPVGAAAEVHHH